MSAQKLTTCRPRKSSPAPAGRSIADALKSRAGNTAMIFALAAAPMVILSGAAVDLSRVETERSRLQAAADAAVLAAARANLVNAGRPDAERRARAIAEGAAFFERAFGAAGAIDFAFEADEEIVATASTTAELVFGPFLGRDNQDIEVTGAAQVADLRRVEVALILDNTASMFDSNRITLMRRATTDFVNTMFDGSPNADLTRIAVVPWSTTVNINSEDVDPNSLAPAASIDPPAAGSRRAPNAPARNRIGNLSNPETGAALSQAELDAMFAPVGWRGCIRAAPNEVRVSSSGAVTSATTDAPPAGMRWPANWIEPELEERWSKERDCVGCPSSPPPPRTSPPPPRVPPSPPPPRTPPPPPRGPQGFNDAPGTDYPRLAGMESLWSIVADETVEVAPVCTRERPVDTGALTPGGKPIKSCDWYATGVLSCNQSDNNGLRNAYVPADQICSPGNRDYSGRLRACVSDPNEFAYLSGGGRMCPWRTDNLPWTANRPVLGPNLNCPTAMLPLSGNRAQVIEKLDHMHPVPGGTQADVGLRWGLRVLSPRAEWANFFGLSAAETPGPWDVAQTRKVAILLTDGENVSPIDFEGYYGCTENGRGSAGNCWRAPGVDRLDANVMDNLTLNVCEAMRETYDVELYTIAVDVPAGRGTTLLANCAGDPDRFFNISSAELGRTFEAIAERELRLTR